MRKKQIIIRSDEVITSSELLKRLEGLPGQCVVRKGTKNERYVYGAAMAADGTGTVTGWRNYLQWAIEEELP